mmetsp:Transcript_59667/g.187108  ORF Transcript_59667/g.187108 Transcript_59667/m.187108 type:complete len:125 (-) Transcript_59667:82-456(-)
MSMTPLEEERHSPLGTASSGASCSGPGPTAPDFVRSAWAPAIAGGMEVAAAVQALRVAAEDDCAGCGCGTRTSEIVDGAMGSICGEMCGSHEFFDSLEEMLLDLAWLLWPELQPGADATMNAKP